MCQHEALINTAFAGRALTIVCPYDADRLDEHVLTDAHGTHPVLWDAGARCASAHYAPLSVHARYNQPLTVAGGAATFRVSTAGDLAKLRRFATEQAQQLGLPPGKAADLELIVTELATNSLRHAGGSCELQVGRDGEHVVCEARDTGDLSDPLAGRRPAQPGQASGRGLLLVHQLADLVRMHTSSTGTAIHTYLRLNGR